MSDAVAVPNIPNEAWRLPSRGVVGMVCLIIAEASIFIIFVVAYVFYIGKSLSGPAPKDVLSLPIFTSICLLSSSLTVHFAVSALHHSKRNTTLQMVGDYGVAWRHISRGETHGSGCTQFLGKDKPLARPTDRRPHRIPGRD